MTPWNQQLAQINDGVLLFADDDKPEQAEAPLSLRSFSSNATKESIYEGENEGDRRFFDEFKYNLKEGKVFSDMKVEDFDKESEKEEEEDPYR